MSPKLERDVLPVDDPSTRFVRQGQEVYFSTGLSHKQMVMLNNLQRGTDEYGRFLVSDGGFIVNNSRTQQIELYGDTTSCAIDRDDIEVAREETVEAIRKITGRETEHLFW